MTKPAQTESINTSDYAQNFPFSEKEMECLFKDVLRDSTEQPGFYYKDLGADFDSKSLRRLQLELKERLSELCQQRLDKQINYQWMSRTNHRNSSKFHIDTAPEQSILILGYEPTSVESKAYLADYTKYLEDQNLSAQDYFRNSINGNFAPDDEALTPYVSEVSPFPKEHYRLLVINNSRSFGQKSYGVFHRGEVPENLNQEDRLVNGVMVSLCDLGTPESYEEHLIANFVNSDLVFQ